MNKLPILVDMDGVFADFMTSYHKIAEMKHKELFKVLPKIEDQKLFYVDEEVEQTYPHLKEIAESIVDDDDVFKNIVPYSGAIEGMKLLRSMAKDVGREIFICTAPHRSNKLSYSQKPEWIEQYLGYDWLNHLLIVRDKSVCSGVVLIDDKPDPLGILEPNWKHVVFNRPYNKNIKEKYRMYDFSQQSISSLLDYCNIFN